MIIVYESKTGFTKKYADMLAAKTGLKAYSIKEFAITGLDDEIVFLGWMKAGSIQGLSKIRKSRIVAVCGSGTARTAEPSPEEVAARNKITGLPFFYLRGGCFPLSELKGMDKFLMSFFLKMLKKRKDKDEELEESISTIEFGYDGVKEENLEPVLAWISAR